jgi:hypothetical protein
VQPCISAVDVHPFVAQFFHFCLIFLTAFVYTILHHLLYKFIPNGDTIIPSMSSISILTTISTVAPSPRNPPVHCGSFYSFYFRYFQFKYPCFIHLFYLVGVDSNLYSDFFYLLHSRYCYRSCPTVQPCISAVDVDPFVAQFFHFCLVFLTAFLYYILH